MCVVECHCDRRVVAFNQLGVFPLLGETLLQGMTSVLHIPQRPIRVSLCLGMLAAYCTRWCSTWKSMLGSTWRPSLPACPSFCAFYQEMRNSLEKSMALNCSHGSCSRAPSPPAREPWRTGHFCTWRRVEFAFFCVCLLSCDQNSLALRPAMQ